MPADEHAPVIKKTLVSRTWMVFTSSGDTEVFDFDKYAIMRRVRIPARDLRILDPLLSYPSALLGRESAIVVNFEVNSQSLFQMFG